MSELEPLRTRGRPRNAFKEGGASVIVALDRGLRVLEHLATHGGATLSELSAETGIATATAHRILSTLSQRGMVELSPGTQKWHVGTEAFRIGNAYLNRTSVVEAARPIMFDLSDKTCETVNLAVENDGCIVFLSQVESDNPIRAFFRPGSRGSMHSSGIGKAVMAHMSRSAVDRIIRRRGLPGFTPKTVTDETAMLVELETIRARGWAFDDEERFIGMRCVAAPVFNAFGEPVAGISLSGPTVRFPDDRIDTFGAMVRDAARAVSDALQGRTDPRHDG